MMGQDGNYHGQQLNGNGLLHCKSLVLHPAIYVVSSSRVDKELLDFDAFPNVFHQNWLMGR